ncbi:MAG: hypothetical protein WCY41_02880 [Candidatus Micrarchaeia archaeon]
MDSARTVCVGLAAKGKTENFTHAKITPAQHDIIAKVDDALKTENSYFFLKDWGGIEKQELWFGQTFFPLVLCNNLLRELPVSSCNVLIIFDKPLSRNFFTHHYLRSFIQNTARGQPEYPCLIPPQGCKNHCWFIPFLSKEIENLKADAESIHYAGLRSNWTSTSKSLTASDIRSMMHIGVARPLPICSMDKKSIRNALSKFEHGPSIILVFFENERWLPSLESWKKYLSVPNESKFIIVTKSVNQLPSPHILRGSHFIHIGASQSDIIGDIKKVVIPDYDSIFDKKAATTLQKNLLEFGKSDRIAYKGLFSIISNMCALMPGEEYRISGIDRSLFSHLSDAKQDELLSAVQSIAANIAMSANPFGKEKYIKDNLSSFDHLVVFGYPPRLETGTEKVFATDESGELPKGKNLIYGVPRLIYGNEELIKLKYLNRCDCPSIILLAGKLEEFLFDLLMSNELFYAKVLEKGKNDSLLTEKDVTDVIPAIGRGAQLPREDDLTVDVFESYAEMKRYAREARKKAEETGVGSNMTLNCVMITLKDQNSRDWELALPVDSEHRITVKRGASQVSAKPSELQIRDIMEKSAWNYTVLVDAIKRMIIDNPDFDESLKGTISKYLLLSEEFRKKLSDSDIKSLVSELEKTGYGIEESTVWNWVDITMSPSKSDCLIELGKMMGYTEDGIHTVIEAFANIKKLREVPPLSKLAESDARLNLTITKLERSEARLEHVGWLRAL